MTKAELARYIDHTLLTAGASVAQIDALCAEAAAYRFASVCVNPVFVGHAAERLAGSGVAVCTVIDFPLGASSSESKAVQAAVAVEHGADEVDMVIAVGAALEGNAVYVEQDIAAVVRAARSVAGGLHRSVIVKAILETCYLSDERILLCCEAALKAGADFVKTSTGFAQAKPNGATLHAVELMRKAVGSRCGVKASGGIRDTQTALAMIAAGANRIGSSSGTVIVDGLEEAV